VNEREESERLVRFYDVGYQEGYTHGRIHGLIEGGKLGKEKGYEMWEEIGFYLGFGRTYESLLKRGLRTERLVLIILSLITCLNG